jgi:hypothetical protein
MENIFIILFYMGGFGLLLCTGVGIVNLTRKVTDVLNQYKHRKQIKESPEKSKANFQKYNLKLKRADFKW